MKRLFALLLLAFASIAGATPPEVKVRFIVSTDAASDFSEQQTTASILIAAGMRFLAAAFANLGCSGGNPTVSYSISSLSFTEYGLNRAAPWETALTYSYDPQLMRERDLGGAAVTVVIVGPNLGNVGTVPWSDSIPSKLTTSVAVISSTMMMEKTEAAGHEIGHMLGGRHWDDPTSGSTTKGAYIRQGGYTTSQQTCVNDIMTYNQAPPATQLPGIPAKTCPTNTGWGSTSFNYWNSGSAATLIPYTCDVVDYCNMIADSSTGHQGNAWTAWQGVVTVATGQPYIRYWCTVTGQSSAGPPPVRQTSLVDPIYDGTGGTVPAHDCFATVLAQFSDPSKTVDGYALGSSTQNAAAAVCANVGTLAGFASSSLEDWARTRRGFFSSEPASR